MRCLVTGATGFVGSHLTRHLLRQHVDVSILMRPESNPWRIKDLLSSVKIIYGDLEHSDQWMKDTEKFKFDLVFHLAWSGANSARYANLPSQIYDNLSGSLALVRMAHECGARTWIGFGSTSEYGVREGILSESLPANPHSLYGVSKYAVCTLAQKLCAFYAMNFIWIRPFWFYGPADNTLRMIPYVIQSLLRKEEPTLTRGEQLWDYLYIQDGIEAIWALANHPSACGIFNVGSGQVYSIASIAERIRDLVDPQLPLGLGKLPYSADQVKHLQADVTCLRSVVDWEPKTDLGDGLKQTIAWYSRQNYDREH